VRVQGLFPTRWPGDSNILLYRLRLDHPPVDLATGKAKYRYLVATGTRNRLYMPLEDDAALQDTSADIWITEGEKKYLALHVAAHQISGNGTGRGAFCPIGLFGVWGWKGIIGITTDANGHRTEVRGVIPDFDRLAWDGRRVFILFDANVATNDSVRAARAQLARELESRGATVYFINLPQMPDVNGVDDFLARQGVPALMELTKQVQRYDWRDELARTDKGKIMGTLRNAMVALRLAPDWPGVLAFNEFSRAVEARKSPPWGDPPGPWDDYQDLRTTEWLQNQGIRISDIVAGKAVFAVARERGRYHPVREYLDSLTWDGTDRVTDWLTLYLGVDPTDYVRNAGRCWMISGVARAEQPGCKADHALILEGAQGGGKSTAFSILGGEFYTDDIADLGTKDAALGTAGVWIVELAELAAMSRPEIEKIKSFISRSTDRFRPPYGRHYIEAPRQCIFGGSVNLSHYFKDDTGNRRFWPVKCGVIKLDELRRDRDQLWAEAVVRYRKNEHWWFETDALVEEATEEQDKRLQTDPWEPEVEAWIANLLALDPTGAECTTAEVLRNAIHKEVGQWNRGDETRVGSILVRLGWESSRPGSHAGSRRRVYRPKP
jgi:predicted P-loop ATPase